jgi:hypothetical protein
VASASDRTKQVSGWQMACRNICEQIGIRGSNRSLYKLGMRYCPTCEFFFFSSGPRCSCCNRVMRIKANKQKAENLPSVDGSN